MANLELTQAESVVLKQVLDNKATALVNEIAHTDDRSYREYLKETATTVDQLLAKVGGAVEQLARARA